MSFTQAALATLFGLAAVFMMGEPLSADDGRAKRFVEYYEATIRPAAIRAAKLFWVASLTGSEEDFHKKQAAEEALDLLLSDKEKFAELKAIKQIGVEDRTLARQIEICYLEALSKQIDAELLGRMTAKSNAVERAFNVFRPELDGEQLTDNAIRQILRESTDSVRRRAAWEAGKRVGPVVVGDLLELVALRNEAARKVGFDNYYVLRLHCGEQNESQLVELFDQLEALTREPFRRAKAELDAALARRYGISVDALRPWHYHDPFFQEAPAILGELPEEVYKPLDPIETCRRFYCGIGLPVEDVLRRSSLYEQPGKNPHAYCIDIDRAGDVRILENAVPGREWLGTTLHELGHAVYSKNVSARLPYVLHTDAHPLCTEGVAMMFERFAANVDWLLAMGAEISDPERFREAAARLRRNRLLIFARYCQVMFRFERALYTDPHQDLNRLWWDLVEKYQEIRRPEGRDAPDFASKYHFIGAPVYYHNYMLGEMFASQLHHALAREVGAVYVGKPAAGEFMRRRVFEPGLTLPWNDLVRRATGEPLSAKAFVQDIEAAK